MHHLPESSSGLRSANSSQRPDPVRLLRSGGASQYEKTGTIKCDLLSPLARAALPLDHRAAASARSAAERRFIEANTIIQNSLVATATRRGGASTSANPLRAHCARVNLGRPWDGYNLSSHHKDYKTAVGARYLVPQPDPRSRPDLTWPNGECRHCGIRNCRKYVQGLCYPCYFKERRLGCSERSAAAAATLGPVGCSKRSAAARKAANRALVAKGLKQRGPNGECRHCGIRNCRKYVQGLCYPCYLKAWRRKR
ncbi:hypothetical protein CHLRE_06g292216v5 [Chlamydomonas reinhardtii]|uniref:Uncharacterized protein n=1 Tax=Chlamydomonas reinhardtii TaxID=3055 RepID=A0A2K3DQD8_CHLRE|nr:uncharacterized protein CHLRE_06g292216v5 [Chlamydomonas reinhardtii]PNW82743.1 hypothetical protein CHLRE_06g292216v5 [Chlamydomonas reinhardtii]